LLLSLLRLLLKLLLLL
jgi:hypothetical protein